MNTALENSIFMYWIIISCVEVVEQCIASLCISKLLLFWLRGLQQWWEPPPPEGQSSPNKFFFFLWSWSQVYLHLKFNRCSWRKGCWKNLFNGSGFLFWGVGAVIFCCWVFVFVFCFLVGYVSALVEAGGAIKSYTIHL